MGLRHLSDVDMFLLADEVGSSLQQCDCFEKKNVFHWSVRRISTTALNSEKLLAKNNVCGCKLSMNIVIMLWLVFMVILVT